MTARPLAHPDVLGADPRPLFFPIEPAPLGLEAPPDRHGQPVRAWVRSLSVMQKEALVVNGATGRAWRLASDEGPYLAGHDAAPCPLSFFTTGMVASYLDGITALAARRDVAISDVRLTLDNHYTMEGSARQRTMTGGARPPELLVEISSAAAPGVVQELVTGAVAASPATGLLHGVHTSRFTLSSNGAEIPLGRVAGLGRPPRPDPGPRFHGVQPAPVEVAPHPIARVTAAAEVEGVPGGAGSSLAEHQHRTLWVRGVCTRREDGVKEVVQNLYQPIGSEFRYLCDDAPERGGRGLAPDAATYLAAGIGFCFMTQFGRYAKIVDEELTAYRISQDTHFSPEGAAGPGRADAVETDVYLDTPAGPGFARTVLDMAEQTCFLHALCRTDLRPRVRVEAA